MRRKRIYSVHYSSRMGLYSWLDYCIVIDRVGLMDLETSVLWDEWCNILTGATNRARVAGMVSVKSLACQLVDMSKGNIDYMLQTKRDIKLLRRYELECGHKGVFTF